MSKVFEPELYVRLECEKVPYFYIEFARKVAGNKSLGVPGVSTSLWLCSVSHKAPNAGDSVIARYWY